MVYLPVVLLANVSFAEVAKDDDASLSTRASAATDAAKDKAGEVKHSVRSHPLLF